MKWGFGIRQKITLSVILCILFTITFAGNMISKYHVSALGSSFSSVYEDRLLVESYIFQLSEILHRKSMMADKDYTPEQLHRLKQQNADIYRLMAAYDKTKLTPQEAVLLKKLKHSFLLIDRQEKMKMQRYQQPVAPSALQQELDLAATHLRHLSAIQLSEAKQLNESSKKIVAGATLLTEMGTALLIFSILVVNVLIFSARLNRHTPVLHHHLN